MDLTISNGTMTTSGALLIGEDSTVTLHSNAVWNTTSGFKTEPGGSGIAITLNQNAQYIGGTSSSVLDAGKALTSTAYSTITLNDTSKLTVGGLASFGIKGYSELIVNDQA